MAYDPATRRFYMDEDVCTRMEKSVSEYADMLRQRDAAMAYAAHANADRESTYQENRILTRLWCDLREKVKALPKADMTIGAWHDLQDFIKSQAHGGGE